MKQAFPYRLEPAETGGVLIQFLDVPEAHSFAPTEVEDDAAHALDCLIAALGGFIKLAQKIPRPSPAQGQPVALLPPLIAAKLALYEAMRAQHITRTALAHRLLDLNHRSAALSHSEARQTI